MDDDDLFGFEPHARRGDPSTSHEAVPKNISKQALRVLFAYEDGDDLLDHTAYRRVGMDRANARLAHQRCSDLRFANLIVRTGARALTPSGKSGYLCRITPAGHAYLEAHRWRLSDDKEIRF